MSKTVHLALDVLELLAGRGAPARLTELAAELDHPKTTVHRTLAALEARSYVMQLPDERYRLGLRCLELGASSAAMLDLRTVARTVVEELNRRTSESIHLAVYERGDVVYVDKVDSPLPVAPKSRVGTRAPALAVATGRAILAFQSSAELDWVLDGPIEAHTPSTVTDPEQLRAMFQKVRDEDLATNVSSWRQGVCGIAAPIRDHTGVVVASVGCCIPEDRFSAHRRDELGPIVLKAARGISRQLGHRTPEGEAS